MLANYHTHSKWCRHGAGEIQDYVEEAVRLGMKEIAITEHVPHKEGFSWIPWEEFPAFDQDLNRVKELYKDRIRVIKGFECEYYPEYLEDYRRFQEEYHYELLILGQHNCGKQREIDVFRPLGEEGLEIYGETVCRGLETGMFRFLAHPDCILQGYTKTWNPSCERVMRRIFSTCQELQIPVEINGNGIRGNRRYPNRETFLLSKEYKLQYLINSDAHHPSHLYDEAGKRTEAFARRFGLEVMPFLPIKED